MDVLYANSILGYRKSFEIHQAYTSSVKTYVPYK